MVSILLFVLDYFRLLNPFKNPMEPVITDFKGTFFAAGSNVRLVPEIFMNYKSLISDMNNISELKNQKRSLTIERDYLKDENSELRKQLGAAVPASYRFIPADVISMNRYMEINQGEEAGIKKDMSVVNGAVFIGRVLKTTSSRSEIILMTDPDLTVPAVSSRGTRGNVSGQLGNFALFDNILQKDPLFLNDTLSTSGEGGFPERLVIGSIVFIDTDDVAVYKKARIKPEIDFSMLKKVFVIAAT